MDITGSNKQWEVGIALCSSTHHNCPKGSTIANGTRSLVYVYSEHIHIHEYTYTQQENLVGHSYKVFVHKPVKHMQVLASGL